ncbi:MAG: adenylate/guanylate cyclase domain-containing protein [Chloroflexota bacterium]
MKRNTWQKFLNWLASLSSKEGTTVKFSPREELVISSSLLFIPAAFFWGLIYFFLGENRSGLIPFSYSFFLGITIFVFLRTRKLNILSSSHQFLTLILPFFLQLSLGGFVSSSAVILWTFTSPLTALLTNKLKVAIRWFVAFILILILGGIVDPYFARANDIPTKINLILFVMNILAVLGISFTLLLYMVNQKNSANKLLAREQRKSDTLLLNILPQEIAEILKNENRLVADAYPEVSILFADLVGFTQLSEHLSPIEMVELLNEVYSNFDRLVEEFGLEKIRTIGDNYMVGAGVPVERPDHAHALAKMALGIREFIAAFPPVNGQQLQFRIGLNSGPVVAGVVGKKKFQYDVWGDMVNVASRMESQGVPGKIQVSRRTYDLIARDFVFEERGVIEVKGKGEMETWFLVGEKIENKKIVDARNR